MNRNMSDEGTIWDKKRTETDFPELDKPTPNKGGFRFALYALLPFILILIVLCIFVATLKSIGGGPLTVDVAFDEYAIYTDWNGEVKVIDLYGNHLVWFCEVHLYKRSMTIKDDKYINATFNDAKTRYVKTMSHIILPTEEKDRIDLHIKIAGNSGNLFDMTRAITMNCVKATAPIMTGDEVLRDRRGEYQHAVYEQMKDGLYHYERLMKDDGSIVTKIIRNDKGQPVRSAKPVFPDYHLTLSQFSILEISPPADEVMQQEKLDQARAAIILEEAALQVEKAKLERLKAERAVELEAAKSGEIPEK